ncbi:hypothetical protein V3C99_015065 [Haemonchus contortus]
MTLLQFLCEELLRKESSTFLEALQLGSQVTSSSRQAQSTEAEDGKYGAGERAVRKFFGRGRETERHRTSCCCCICTVLEEQLRKCRRDCFRLLDGNLTENQMAAAILSIVLVLQYVASKPRRWHSKTITSPMHAFLRNVMWKKLVTIATTPSIINRCLQ